MKIILFAAAAALPTLAQAQTAPAPAAPAAAPAAATATVGAAVVDTGGAQVGTVEAVTPQAVLINTGTTKVGVAPQSLTGGAKGLTIAMTKAQLDAAGAQQAQQTAAALQQKLVPGATVTGAGGASVGTVKATDGQYVTVTTTKGDVKLPVSGFGPAANGVVVGLTQAQIDQATAGNSAAGGTSASAGSGTAAAGTSASTTSTTTTDTSGSTAQPDAAVVSDVAPTKTTTKTTKSTKRTTRSN